MRTIKSFELTQIESLAIESAFSAWLELAKLNTVVPGVTAPPDRKLFTDLGDAVRSLQRALAPFNDHPTGSSTQALLCYMQEAELQWGRPAAEHEFRSIIEGLSDPLELLNDASKLGTGGRGNAPDYRVVRWVTMAAAQWKAHQCGSVSASPTSRFYQALQVAHGRHSELPTVTERNIRTAINKSA